MPFLEGIWRVFGGEKGLEGGFWKGCVFCFWSWRRYEEVLPGIKGIHGSR